MGSYRPWAFMRRLQYGAGYAIVLSLLLTPVYFSFFYAEPTCFDNSRNGGEEGVDCGGACDKVCAFTTEEPKVLWTKAFRISEGIYNVVSYVENRNIGVGAKNVPYTISVYDKKGSILTSVKGTTGLPPDSVYPIFAGRVAVGKTEVASAVLVLDPIDTWERMEYGREQFTVLSRTLTGADYIPRLNATLYNTALEDSHDVEVVATIFDSHKVPLTASRTTIPLFEARAEKNITFTWPEPIAKTFRSCEVPSDVILAIDLSGSINNDGGNPPEPVTSVLKAASAFASRLEMDDKVSVVTFATVAEKRAALTENKGLISDAILKLAVNPKDEQGNTNIGDALAESEIELSSARHNPDARKVIVLITDGKANAPEPVEDAEGYALFASNELKKRGTEIFTIGLGKEVNTVFLKQLATADKNSYFATDRSALEDIYNSISQGICEEGAAIIEIIPKPESIVK